MRFSYAESMTDPSFYPALARAAEEAGYDSMVVPDSICYPEHSVSTYPFNPDGSREFLADKPFLEPFSLIPALGAVTTRLRFVTFVLKLPVRNPVLVAKQATSTAVLTGNRLVLGVGSSPWREDYEALGVPWERRGRRMDEELAVIRGLSAGEYFQYHGEIFDIPAIKIAPVPDEPIPILIGGHSDAALRHAADGVHRPLADIIEMRGVAADDAAQANDGVIGPGVRHACGDGADLEGPRHMHDAHRRLVGTVHLQRLESALEQRLGDRGIEAGNDDADGQARGIDLPGQVRSIEAHRPLSPTSSICPSLSRLVVR